MILKKNRNGNVLTNTVHDQFDIATLLKPRHGRITQRRGVEVDSRTSGHSDKVPEGGHLSFFSLFFFFVLIFV